jgi:heme exporter protein D
MKLYPPNPISSEAGAFGFLVWFVAVVAVIAVIVLVVQAIA